MPPFPFPWLAQEILLDMNPGTGEKQNHMSRFRNLSVTGIMEIEEAGFLDEIGDTLQHDNYQKFSLFAAEF